MQPQNSIHVDMLPLYHLLHTQVIRPGSKAVFNLLGAQLPAQKTRILVGAQTPDVLHLPQVYIPVCTLTVCHHGTPFSSLALQKAMLRLSELE